MTATVDSIFDEYARRYTERDIEGVTNLCLSPFVAIRRGEALHMADRDAVRFGQRQCHRMDLHDRPSARG